MRTRGTTASVHRPSTLLAVYELTIQSEFCAAHAIVVAGGREPVHGHNWRVTATIAADALDSDGLVCDFHKLHKQLRDILAPLNNADLNRTPPFDELNPTAEHVAMHIGRQLASTIPTPARLVRLRVTEAPGCAATYIP